MTDFASRITRLFCICMLTALIPACKDDVVPDKPEDTDACKYDSTYEGKFIVEGYQITYGDSACPDIHIYDSVVLPAREISITCMYGNSPTGYEYYLIVDSAFCHAHDADSSFITDTWFDYSYDKGAEGRLYADYDSIVYVKTFFSYCAFDSTGDDHSYTTVEYMSGHRTE